MVGKRAAKQADKPISRVRVLRVEVKQINGSGESDTAARTQLRELCEMVQQATNFAWMEWFAWHHSNRSADLIRAWLSDVVAWHGEAVEARGDKPRLALKTMSPELSQRLYHGVTSQWPMLHTRVVALMLNRLTSLISAKKAATGSLPGWMAILLYRESVPSSIHPLPIPFDTPKTAASSNGNAKLLLPETDEASHRIVLSLGREEVEGKKVRAAIRFDCQIWDRGRQMVGRRNTLKKIARGEYQMKGSQLCFAKGKIFADITYELTDSIPVAGEKSAMVTPGRKHPLLIRVAGANRSRWVLGDGRSVIERRRQLASQRLGRMSAYRESPTSNSKGHGRHRSLEKVTKLSRTWREYVTTMNRNLAAALVKECQFNGVGRIILGRPKKASRFLSTAGVDPRHDTTSWDWYALEAAINRKCAEAGIVVEARSERVGDGGASSKKQGKRKAGSQARVLSVTG